MKTPECPAPDSTHTGGRTSRRPRHSTGAWWTPGGSSSAPVNKFSVGEQLPGARPATRVDGTPDARPRAAGKTCAPADLHEELEVPSPQTAAARHHVLPTEQQAAEQPASEKALTASAHVQKYSKARSSRQQRATEQHSQPVEADSKEPNAKPEPTDQPEENQLSGNALPPGPPAAGPSRASKPTLQRSKAPVKQEATDSVTAEPAMTSRPRRLTAQLAMRRLKGDKDMAPPDLFADKQLAVEQLVKLEASSIHNQDSDGDGQATTKQRQQQGNAKQHQGSKADREASVQMRPRRRQQQQQGKADEGQDVIDAANTLTVLSQDQQTVDPGILPAETHSTRQASKPHNAPSSSAAQGTKPIASGSRRAKAASDATGGRQAARTARPARSGHEAQGVEKAAGRGSRSTLAAKRRHRQSVLASSSDEAEDVKQGQELGQHGDGKGAHAGDEHEDGAEGDQQDADMQTAAVDQAQHVQGIQAPRRGQKRMLSEAVQADSGAKGATATAEAASTSVDGTAGPAGGEQLPRHHRQKRRKQMPEEAADKLRADLTESTAAAAAAVSQGGVAGVVPDQPHVTPAQQGAQELAPESDAEANVPLDVDMVPSTQLDSPADQQVQHVAVRQPMPAQETDSAQQMMSVDGGLPLQMGALLQIVQAASPKNMSAAAATAAIPSGAAAAAVSTEASDQQGQQPQAPKCSDDVQVDTVAATPSPDHPPAPLASPRETAGLAAATVDPTAAEMEGAGAPAGVTAEPAGPVEAVDQACEPAAAGPDAAPVDVPTGGASRPDAEDGAAGAGEGQGLRDGMDVTIPASPDPVVSGDVDGQQASSELPAQKRHRDAAPGESCVHPASPPFMRSRGSGQALFDPSSGAMTGQAAGDQLVMAQLQQLQMLQAETNQRLEALQMLQQGPDGAMQLQQQLPLQQPQKGHPSASLPLPPLLPGSSAQQAVLRSTVTPQQSRSVRLNAIPQVQATSLFKHTVTPPTQPPILLTQARQQQAAVAAARRASAAPDQFFIDFNDDEDEGELDMPDPYIADADEPHILLPPPPPPQPPQHAARSHDIPLQGSRHQQDPRLVDDLQEMMYEGQDMVDDDLLPDLDIDAELQGWQGPPPDCDFLVQHTEQQHPSAGHLQHTGGMVPQRPSLHHDVGPTNVALDSDGSLGANSLGAGTGPSQKPAFRVRNSALILLPPSTAVKSSAPVAPVHLGHTPRSAPLLTSSADLLHEPTRGAQGLQRAAQGSRVPVLKPGLRAQQPPQTGSVAGNSMQTSSSGRQGSQGVARSSAVQALVERAAKGLAAQSTKARTVSSHIEGWSSEQLRALHTAYKQTDPKHPRFWQEVAVHVPGRTAAECFSCMFNQHKTPEAKARVPRPLRLATSQPAVKHEEGDDEEEGQEGVGMEEDVAQAGPTSLLPPGRKPTMAATLRWAREQHTRATIERLAGSNGASSSGATAGGAGNRSGLLPELAQALQQKEQADKYITSFLRQSGGWNKWQRTCKSGIQRRAQTDIAALAAASGPPSAASTVTGAIHAALQEVQDLEADLEDEDLMQEADYYFDME